MTLFSSYSAYAETCKLTDEYRNARSSFAISATESLQECRTSVAQAEYWNAFTQCIKQRDDVLLDSTCAHIAGRYAGGLNYQERYKSLGITADFCEMLSVTSLEMKALFKEHIEKSGIVMCKKA